MRLEHLHIHHLRNIRSTRLVLHPQYNLFYGPNGSGKTSVLEAVYLLGSGRSFRTRENIPLVNFNEKVLTVFAQTCTAESISIQKDTAGASKVQRTGQVCRSRSELASFLPCQVFYQDIFQIMDAGPAVRRSLLDWGVFHVEPSYHATWVQYKQVLKQRNALLRQRAPKSHYTSWDLQLVELGHQLDAMRASYFEKWSIAFDKQLSQLGKVACNIRYDKGWGKLGEPSSLAETLSAQFEKDVIRQYTASGPHQADILFEVQQKKAKPVLSRGQQKIVLIALKLAQASMLNQECIYLFDDFTAELDAEHLGLLFQCLDQLKGQLFITATDPVILQGWLADKQKQIFSVKEGIFSALSVPELSFT